MDKLWGNPAWKTLHIFAKGYIPSKRRSATAFVYSFADLLPCIDCNKEFVNNIKLIPLVSNDMDYLASAELFFKWTWIQHNLVNKRIGKKQISFKEAVAIHSNANNSCGCPAVIQGGGSMQI
jgi:hypothetical protein